MASRCAREAVTFRRRQFGLALLVVAWAGCAAAESRLGLVSFKRLEIPDDVPAHVVTALAQDRDGFLWIGTQDGLVRWDGYAWRVFQPVAADAHSLCGAYVRALHAASDGRLWVGTFADGLCVYDPGTERFERWRHDPRDARSLAHDRVEGLAEDRQGHIWIATYEGLCRLARDGRIERVLSVPADPEGPSAERVRALLVDRTGRLWIGGSAGLRRWNDERRRLERVAIASGQADALAGDFISKLYEDARGRVWIGTTEHGAAVFDPATGRLQRLRPRPADAQGLSHFWVSGITEVARGEVWIATFGGGLDVIDPDSLRVVERLRSDATLPSTIGGDRVGALLRDRSGLVFVGAWGQGLARHDPSTRAFRALRHSPQQPLGLSHPAAVRAMEMSGGTLWVGTNGNGVDHIDRTRGLVGGMRPGRAGLTDGAVTCLARGPDGSAWVATLSGALHRLRPGARRFELLTRAQGLPGGPIRALTFAPDGALWAGAAEGLARIDPHTSRARAFRHDPADVTSLSSHAVEALAFTSDGTLWVGTDAGLDAFDTRSGRSLRVHHEAGRADSLPHDWVPDLLVARDGRLWVATPAGAAILTSWDGRTARFEPVARRLGREPAPVRTLIEDAQGHVWLGPTLRVDPVTWRAQEFGPADGPDFRGFFIASRARTADGTLLFGALEGLLLVRPDEIVEWRDAPPVVATALYVDGQPRVGAARLARLTLAPEEHGLRLDFAALDLSAPARHVYRYQLEGYDSAWIAAAAAHRSLTYTNLLPGRYTLRVQGSNRERRFSPRELRLLVDVLPAWHQTLPARAAASLGVLALAYAGYRLRVRGLRARGRELTRLVGERTLALAARGEELARAHAELQVAYARIEDASLTDPLTGLRNRRFFEHGIAADMQLALRRRGAADGDLVFALVDLDHFKAVNDTYGHAAGDAVLVQAASVLRTSLRASDTLVRWGGEEFLVVMRFVDREQAAPLAEKLRAALENHAFLLADGTTLRRSGSIGFAPFPFSTAHPAAASWEDVVQVADCCLYAAKRAGRNRCVGVEGGPSADALARFLAQPAAALARGDVRLLGAPVGASAWT